MPPIYSVVSFIKFPSSRTTQSAHQSKTETSHTVLPDETGDGRSRFQRSSLGSMAYWSGGHK